MNEKDNLDLYEEREHEILEELGRMSLDDPNRKVLIQELNIISTIRVNYDQTELTRLNNNRRNDIDEAKLIIEEEKVKNDRRKNIALWVQAGLSFLGGAFLTVKSYHMDETGYPYRDLKQFALKQIDRIRGR